MEHCDSCLHCAGEGKRIVHDDRSILGFPRDGACAGIEANGIAAWLTRPRYGKHRVAVVRSFHPASVDVPNGWLFVAIGWKGSGTKLWSDDAGTAIPPERSVASAACPEWILRIRYHVKHGLTPGEVETRVFCLSTF